MGPTNEQGNAYLVLTTIDRENQKKNVHSEILDEYDRDMHGMFPPIKLIHPAEHDCREGLHRLQSPAGWTQHYLAAMHHGEPHLSACKAPDGNNHCRGPGGELPVSAGGRAAAAVATIQENVPTKGITQYLKYFPAARAASERLLWTFI